MNWKALGIVVAIFTIATVIALVIEYSVSHIGTNGTGVWVVIVGGSVVYYVLKDSIT